MKRPARQPRPTMNVKRDFPPFEGGRARPRFELTLAANGFDDAIDNAMISQRVTQLAEAAARQAREQKERSPRTRQILRSLVETARYFTVVAIRHAILAFHYSRYPSFYQAFEHNMSLQERMRYEDFMRILHFDIAADMQNTNGVFNQGRPLEPYHDVVLPIPNASPGMQLVDPNTGALPETWTYRPSNELRAERVLQLTQQALQSAQMMADRGGQAVMLLSSATSSNLNDYRLQLTRRGDIVDEPDIVTSPGTSSQSAGESSLQPKRSTSQTTSEQVFSDPYQNTDAPGVSQPNQQPGELAAGVSSVEDPTGSTIISKLIRTSENFNVDLTKVGSSEHAVNTLPDTSQSNSDAVEYVASDMYPSKSLSARILQAMTMSSHDLIVPSPRYNSRLQEFEYPLVYHGSNSATRVNLRERLPRHYTGANDQRHMSQKFDRFPVDTTITEEEEPGALAALAGATCAAGTGAKGLAVTAGAEAAIQHPAAGSDIIPCSVAKKKEDACSKKDEKTKMIQ